MAGPGSTYTGPLLSGPIWNPGDLRGAVNVGVAVLSQQVSLAVNGATAVTASFNVPAGSQLLSFYIDTTVAWNSGTSDYLTIGLTAGGTDFLGNTSVATAGRQVPTSMSAAELTAMLSVGTNNGVPVYVTVTPAGTAATTGATTVTIIYIQTVQLNADDA